jgi:phosphoheptose isomerase
MESLDAMWTTSAGAEAYSRDYANHLRGLVEALDFPTLAAIGDIIDSARRDGRTVYCVGNGGSAATASHFSTDLSWARRRPEHQVTSAISLVSNTPLMTAVANDIGYEEVFTEQLMHLFRPGDVLFAISASGNSANLLSAITYANEHEGITIGLTGFDGGKMKDACQTSLHVEAPLGMYELVEDVQHSVCHMIATYLKRKAIPRST